MALICLQKVFLFGFLCFFLKLESNLTYGAESKYSYLIHYYKHMNIEK